MIRSTHTPQCVTLNRTADGETLHPELEILVDGMRVARAPDNDEGRTALGCVLVEYLARRLERV